MSGPTGVTVAGRFTRNPGIYASVVYAFSSSQIPLSKKLAVLGSFPYLKPYTPYEEFSRSSLVRLAPNNLELKRIAGIIYGAAADDDVSGAPYSVSLVNVRNSTRGGLQVKNEESTPEPLFTAYALSYGSAGGRSKLAITRSGSDYPYSYAITVAKDGVAEVFEAVGENLLEVTYGNGASVFEAVTMALDPDADLVINGSVAAEMPGTTWAVGESCTGVVTVTPSKAPSAGETFTATITGVDAAGGTKVQSLTWTAGESGAQESDAFAVVSAIDFAETGADTPTFAASFDIYRRSAVEQPALSTVADEINNTSTEFSATANSDLGDVLFLGDADKRAAVDVTTKVVLHNVMGAIASELDGSALIDYELDTSGHDATTLGATSGAVDTYLSGGSDGPGETTAGYISGLAALEQRDIQILVPLSESAAVHSEVRAHCNTMASVGANERCAWVGAGRNKTLSELKALIRGQNSRHLSMVAQEVQRYGPVGKPEWLTPKYTALLLASMQAAVGFGVPISKKTPDILDVRQNSSWDENADREAALAVGLTHIESPIGGFRVCRALTTFTTVTDSARQDASANESVDTCIRAVRLGLEGFVADAADASLRVRIESATRDILQGLVGQSIIQSFVAGSVVATQSNDVWVVGFDFSPVYPANFIVVMPRIVSKSVTINPLKALAA